jgi:hypothetical protein
MIWIFHFDFSPSLCGEGSEQKFGGRSSRPPFCLCLWSSYFFFFELDFFFAAFLVAMVSILPFRFSSSLQRCSVAIVECIESLKNDVKGKMAFATLLFEFCAAGKVFSALVAPRIALDLGADFSQRENSMRFTLCSCGFDCRHKKRCHCLCRATENLRAIVARRASRSRLPSRQKIFTSERRSS